jgi:hypothetical protein
MPSFDLANAVTTPLLFLTTIGTVLFGVMSIVYSVIFAGRRIVKPTPRQVQMRLFTAIITSVLVIVLAALDIFLAFAS